MWSQVSDPRAILMERVSLSLALRPHEDLGAAGSDEAKVGLARLRGLALPLIGDLLWVEEAAGHGVPVERLRVLLGILRSLAQRLELLESCSGAGQLLCDVLPGADELVVAREDALDVLLGAEPGIEFDGSLRRPLRVPVLERHRGVAPGEGAQGGLEQLAVLHDAFGAGGGLGLGLEATQEPAGPPDPPLEAALQLAARILAPRLIRVAAERRLDPPGERRAVLHLAGRVLRGDGEGLLEGGPGVCGRTPGARRLPGLPFLQPRGLTGSRRRGRGHGEDPVAGPEQDEVGPPPEELGHQCALALGAFELGQGHPVSAHGADPLQGGAHELVGEPLEEGADGAVVLVDPALLEVETGCVWIGCQAQSQHRGAFAGVARRLQNEQDVPGREPLDVLDQPAGEERLELLAQLGDVPRRERGRVAGSVAGQASSSLTL